MTDRLVGRDRDLRRIEPLLGRLADGRGGLLVVSGEPGIGKTRYAEEALRMFRGVGARTAWATAWLDAGTPPLWMWRQILRQLDLDTVALDAPAPESADDADAARFAMFATVAAALRQAADRGPVVIVLDDLQWADTASVRLLEFVADVLRDSPCVLVALARHSELAADDLARLARRGTQVTLGGLDPESVREVLALTVDDALAAAVHEVVATRSGGNPLFVGEFARLIGATGRTEVAAGAVPPAVGAVLQRRLARMSESVVATLQVAAVLGKEFDVASIERLTASYDIPHDVAPDIDAAVRGELVTRLGRHEFAFAHDLIRDVVLDSLPVARKVPLHRAAAALAAETVDRDPNMRAQLASHLEEAGDVQEACGHWRAAAAWHRDRLSFEQAAAWFGRAAALTSDPTERIDLVLAEADALLRAGDLSRARERFVSAADLARAESDGERLVTAVLGIGAGAAAWEVPFSDSGYTTLVEEALAQLGPDAHRLRASLLARLSVAAATPETLDRSRALAEEARELARGISDPAQEAHALAALCDALGGPQHVRARLQNAAEIVRLADHAGDRLLGLLGTRFRVVALLELGQFSELDHVIADFERRAEQLRQPLLSWYAPLFRGMRALLKGHLSDAERHQALVAAAAEHTGSTNATLLAITLTLGIDTARGRVSDSTTFDGIVDVDPAAWASYAAGVGYVALRAGDRDRAQTMLRLHSENGFARIGDDAEHLTTVAHFGRIALALGETEAVASLYDALRPFAGMWIVDGIAAVCWGPVDLELARMATGLGRDEAAAHLDDAEAAVVAAGAELLKLDVAELRARLDRPADAQLVESPAGGNQWRREGDFWTLAYAGRTVRVKHTKGIADLTTLLAAPGREVHVSDLYGGTTSSRTTSRRTTEGDLGDMLDPQARAAYRQRLEDLEPELQDASAIQDLGRVEQLRIEQDFLLAELSAALGLGGRARRVGDPNERFRKAVGTRIKFTIDRIADSHPALAAHLRNSVRTGIFCVYLPETPVRWNI
jgi:predicted ATPase